MPSKLLGLHGQIYVLDASAGAMIRSCQLLCHKEIDVDDHIEYCKIYPPIGIARVGNSEEDFFIGPETPDKLVEREQQNFKDSHGRVLRQAARFRIFAFNRNNQVIRELTSAEATIEWSVELANKKSSWNRFEGAKKVAAVVSNQGRAPDLRNDHITEPAERAKLNINGGQRRISGEGQRSKEFSGPFLGLDKDVYLGELRTDERGNLLVLGGRGVAGTPIQNNPLVHYANNEQWYDDTSDGPVSATVTLKGADARNITVRGRSWVIVAPPHYSPYTKSVVTLYDVMQEAAVDHELIWSPELGARDAYDADTVFQRDILPLLQRVSVMQWVSEKAQRGHGRGTRGDFLTPESLAVLSNPEEAKKADSLHKRIFKYFRTPLQYPLMSESAKSRRLNPDSHEAHIQANLHHMPPLSGNEGDQEHGEPETWLSVTALQYEHLKRWQAGQFISVNGQNNNAGQNVVNPRNLTIAALESCQGGGFYPGMEITSIVRVKNFYGTVDGKQEAFRVSDAYTAGDITKWMANPWQADFDECAGHWWPAIRPDDVLPQEIFEELNSGVSNHDMPATAFKLKAWERGVGMQDIPRPGLAIRKTGADEESASLYRQRAEQELHYMLARFVRIRFHSISALIVREGPTVLESAEVYRSRAIAYWQASVFTTNVDLPPVVQDETANEYRTRLRTHLIQYFRDQIVLPAVGNNESPDHYVTRVQEEMGGNSQLQKILTIEWRNRHQNASKNDLVQKWARLGFVVPKQLGRDRTVLVETEREQYDLMSFRDYFYICMNKNRFSSFFDGRNSMARRLADSFFAQAKAMYPELSQDPSQAHYAPFEYTKDRLQARLDEIYRINQRDVEQYVAGKSAIFNSKEAVRQRILQLSPFNLLDGAWLQGVNSAGVPSEVKALLLKVWFDEKGNGNLADDHSRVYENLLHSAGFYLPPIESREFADNPDILEPAYAIGVYQLCVAAFTEEYLPEILGMTLELEWEANTNARMVKLYDHFGFPSLFYSLHLTIDNAAEGHGAYAKRAVEIYLDQVFAKSGSAGVKEQWERIWSGFVAFAYVGGPNLGYLRSNPPSARTQMIRMLASKKYYGSRNHGTQALGYNSINHWFDEPDAFLDQLANSHLIVRGNAAKSPIFELMTPTGKMYKVFTDLEIKKWEAWINSLTPNEDIASRDHSNPGEAMMSLVDIMRAKGIASTGHQGYDFTISVSGVPVTKPLNYWFTFDDPRVVMLALKDTSEGWIIPGNLEESKFFDKLSAHSPMSKVLSISLPEIGNKTGKTIIAEWVRGGCIVPNPKPDLSFLVAPLLTEEGGYSPLLSSPEVTPVGSVLTKAAVEPARFFPAARRAHESQHVPLLRAPQGGLSVFGRPVRHHAPDVRQEVLEENQGKAVVNLIDPKEINQTSGPGLGAVH